MQTLRYIYIMLRWPPRWRNPWGLLWDNTIPGRWMWYLGACCRLWPEYARDLYWAAQHHNNSMWRQLWWMSIAWAGMVWRMRGCRVMGHNPGEVDGYHIWCKRCKHDIRNTKELSGMEWWRNTGWEAVKMGCFIGAVIAVVYYVSWPLFKWLVRVAIE